MKNLDEVFQRLGRSPFRARFHLSARDVRYIADRGLPVVLAHARDIIEQRLAPAHPPNDGKQTPFRGHPVFVAQHATATCCRGCLVKLHGIPAGARLGEPEVAHVVAVIERWLSAELERVKPSPAKPVAPKRPAPAPKRQPDLFD